MNNIIKAYKVELNPNNVQVTKLKQNIGSARWAYNWGLQRKIEEYQKNKKTPSSIGLHEELIRLKKTEIPWMYNSSKCSPQEALRDLDKAFSNFFIRCKKGYKTKGFPKFKSKHNEKQSFRLYGHIKNFNTHIQLPTLGKIKLKETDYIPLNCKIVSATVSKRVNKWFVSVQVEEEFKPTTQSINEVIGVDLGIKTLATCSDGTIYQNPKALKTNLKSLKRLQRNLSRKVKKSKNYEKAKRKLNKKHYRISNIRKDTLHKITTKIINENQVIVLEDLKVTNMMKNHKLAQAISDVGLYEFRRQIEYKAKWNNRKVIFVNTFYPSSKLCSCCKNKKTDLTLKDRVYNCNVCGLNIDRDLNASLNLKQFYTESSSGFQACGEQSSLNSEMNLVSCSVKQEFNRKRKYTLKGV